MPIIKPSCIRDIRERASIVEVISRVTTLKKAGSRYKGLCPFHNEKTPSFNVNPTEGYYKCFGCGEGGDVIKFVQKTEHLNFTEAVETLASRFSIPLEYEANSGAPSAEQRSLREELFAIHQLAADYYHQTFRNETPTGDFMRPYWINSRKFTLELAEEFKIGAATPNDTALAQLLLQKKFSEQSLRECGLFFLNEHTRPSAATLRPRFRGRLMIPIRDHQSRIVAFTARQTELTPDTDPSREAKYVNSPETPIFIKSNLLFNLDRALAPASKENKPFVLVEGQLDAIRCWSVGLKTAIAPQGTSITEQQIALIRRYSNQVECLFDSDAAGQKASMRFLGLALQGGIEPRFLALSGDTKIDPDQLFLDRGISAYADLRQNAKSAIAYACQSLLPNPSGASPLQKSETVQQIFALITPIDSAVTRNQLLTEAAQHLRILPGDIIRDFDNYNRQHHRRTPNLQSQQQPQIDAGTSSTSDGKDTPEHHLLSLLIHHPELGPHLAIVLHHECEWVDTSTLAGALLNRLLAEFEHDTAFALKDHLPSLAETEAEQTLLASISFDPPANNPVSAANLAISQLQARFLGLQKKQIELDLAALHADSPAPQILAGQLIAINKQLRSPPRLGIISL